MSLSGSWVESTPTDETENTTWAVGLSPAPADPADATSTARAQRTSPDPTASDAAPPAPDLQPGIDEATQIAAQAGATVGIAVLDRVTGRHWTNGPVAEQPFFTASLVKLFVADNLLHRQRTGEITLPPSDVQLLSRILTVSDDGAVEQLYAAYGGAEMVREVADRYGLRGLLPSTDPGFWELTQVSPLALVRWYDRFVDTAPAADRDYVLDHLRSSPQFAADGFNQWFGIPHAQPGQVWALKQGWMLGVRGSAWMHTSALLGPDSRYAVAILVQDPGDVLPATLLDQLAASVLPPGLLT